MSMRTELGKVRGIGPAHEGTSHFWKQRLTAISNLPLVIFLIWFVMAHLGASRADVVAAVKNPFEAIGLGLAMISICWHMKLGLQIVVEDYVHAPSLKITSLILVNFYAFGLAIVALYAILKMNIGA